MKLHPRPQSPGKGYRFIRVGESIGYGTEVYDFGAGKWRGVGSIRGAVQTEQNRPFPFGWYRCKAEEKEPLRIQSCQFVEASDLFRGFSKLYNAWMNGGGSDDFTFGDCNRSMLVVSRVIASMEKHGVNNRSDFRLFLKRCEQIPAGTHVDFEN